MEASDGTANDASQTRQRKGQCHVARWVLFGLFLRRFLKGYVGLESLTIKSDAVYKRLVNQNTSAMGGTSSLFGGLTRNVPPMNEAVAAAVAVPGATVIDMGQDLKRITYWGENAMCGTLRGNISLSASSPSVILNISFGCGDLYQGGGGGLGTGNWISSFLGIRLAALAHGNVDTLLTCPDAVKEQRNLILPWLMGYWPRLKATNFPSPLPKPPGGKLSLPDLDRACKGYDHCPIGIMMPNFRFELRRMAVTLVGIPKKDHPAAKFAEDYLWGPNQGSGVLQIPTLKRGADPLFPNVELDDAVLHFRCGDLVFSNHPSFGFMKFSAYRKRISPAARSIGIVTQPFDGLGQNRPADAGSGKRNKCRALVEAFDEYLSAAFPSAKITVRNDPTETIALTYARMIMANQTIVAISSFGVFGAVANFGTGYIRKPDFRKAPNQWLLLDPALDTLYDDVFFMNEPDRLMVGGQVKTLRKMKGDKDYEIEWFKNDTFCLGGPCKGSLT